MKKILAMLLLATFALPALAGRFNVPKNAAFEEECASCHIAYPPQLLDATSWRALMGGLPKHFGTDASVDETRRRAIADFLTNNAGHRASRDANDKTAGKPALRISETAWFRREHDEVAAATWKRASIKSPANCAACHTQAAAGDYRERNIRIPQ